MIASEELKWKIEEVQRNNYLKYEPKQYRSGSLWIQLFKIIEEINDELIKEKYLQNGEFYRKLYDEFLISYQWKGTIVNELEIVQQNGNRISIPWSVQQCCATNYEI